MIDAEPHGTTNRAHSLDSRITRRFGTPSRYAQPRLYRRSVGSRNWCAEDTGRRHVKHGRHESGGDDNEAAAEGFATGHVDHRL
jgi:hypothetical protein